MAITRGSLDRVGGDATSKSTTARANLRRSRSSEDEYESPVTFGEEEDEEDEEPLDEEGDEGVDIVGAEGSREESDEDGVLC